MWYRPKVSYKTQDEAFQGTYTRVNNPVACGEQVKAQTVEKAAECDW